MWGVWCQRDGVRKEYKQPRFGYILERGAWANSLPWTDSLMWYVTHNKIHILTVYVSLVVMAKVWKVANYGITFAADGSWMPTAFSTEFMLYDIHQVEEHRLGIWIRMSLYIEHLDENDARDIASGRLTPQHAKVLRARRIRFFNWAVTVGVKNFDQILNDGDCNKLRDGFKKLLNKKLKMP